MTLYFSLRPPGGPPPSHGLTLLVVLLTISLPLIAIAIAWPTYAPVCAIVIALVTAVLREVHNLPPRP